MATHRLGYWLISEAVADDPWQYSRAVFDRSDGYRAEVYFFGPELASVDATFAAEPTGGSGRWDGVGRYVLPRYGKVGGGAGALQVLVGLDDGSLMNITWRNAGPTRTDRAALLGLTEDITRTLLAFRPAL